MKHKGIINITDTLKLKDPTLEVHSVTYGWEDDSVTLNINFSEGAFPHRRSFTFINQGSGEIGIAEIMGFISSHEILGKFN